MSSSLMHSPFLPRKGRDVKCGEGCHALGFWCLIQILYLGKGNNMLFRTENDVSTLLSLPKLVSEGSSSLRPYHSPCFHMMSFAFSILFVIQVYLCFFIPRSLSQRFFHVRFPSFRILRVTLSSLMGIHLLSVKNILFFFSPSPAYPPLLKVTTPAPRTAN